MSYKTSVSAPLAALARKKWATLLAFVVGGFGGYVFDLLNFPLGWLFGSMFATGILAIIGFRPRIPGILRWMVMAVLGVYLGASFTPEIKEWLPRSIFSITIMYITVILEVVIATYLVMKYLKCNLITSYAASMPGGFSTMLIIARENGGDEQTVSQIQLIRIVFVILIITFLAKHLGGDYETSTELIMEEIIWKDMGFAFAIMIIGLAVGLITKLPIFCMITPMVVLGLLEIFSLTTISLANEPLSIALVILGASVGSRWGSLKNDNLKKCLVAGVILSICLIGFSILSAWLVAKIIDFELLPLILAYSPGGIAEISLIAIALNIDPAFVGMHHMLRVLFIFLSLPFIIIYLRNLQKA